MGCCLRYMFALVVLLGCLLICSGGLRGSVCWLGLVVVDLCCLWFAVFWFVVVTFVSSWLVTLLVWFRLVVACCLVW